MQHQQPPEVANRLTNLENDSFQLKLRNYYLERRLNASLTEREQNEQHLNSLMNNVSAADADDSHHTRPAPSPRSSDIVVADIIADPALDRHAAPSRQLERSHEKDLSAPTLQVDEMRAELVASRQELQAAKLRQHELEAQIQVLASKCAALQAELTQVKQHAEAQQKTAEDLVAYEAEQIADLETQNERLKQQLQKHDQARISTTATVDSLRRDIDRAFDFLRTDHFDHDDANRRVHTLLLKGRDILEEARRHRRPVDERLADCLDLGLQVADSSPSKASPTLQH